MSERDPLQYRPCVGAMLINSAVVAVKGDLSDKAKVGAAMKKADFTSLRGPFKLSPNGYPIQDFYLTNAICRASPTMQRCSSELLHGEDFAEAAE